MKKRITKLISVVSTAIIFISAMPFTASVATASAENVPVLDLSSEGDYYVPESLCKNSNYSLGIKVYVGNLGDEKITSAKLKFVSDSDVGFVESNDKSDGVAVQKRKIIFKNISSQMSGAKTNRYAEATGADEIYNKDKDEKDWKTGAIGTHSYMKSDGNGGVYFTLTEKETPNSTPVTKTLSTADESLEMYRWDSGGVRFRYSYIDQKTFNKKVGTAEYPYFDEKLPKDQPLTGWSDTVTWSGDTSSVTMSDEKEGILFCELNIAGMAKGDYTISLDPNETTFTTSVNGKNVVHSLSDGTISSTKATIHIVDGVKVTDADINKKLYYYSDSDDIVTTKDVIKSIKADVITNGQKQNIDITKGIGKIYCKIKGSFIEGPDNCYTVISLPLTYSGYNPVDEDEDILTTDIYVGLKGDANLDGKVDSKDAVTILKYYASALVSGGQATLYAEDPAFENFAYYLADVDGGSKDHGASGSTIDSKDAVLVLKYYAIKLANSNATWEDVQ
ncbi:MAG: hypothetical protein PUB76_04430 [Oscillospiraceae bacterium]|nr:hypothetical protein [Oscillospiraceae bacterium]